MDRQIIKTFKPVFIILNNLIINSIYFSNFVFLKQKENQIVLNFLILNQEEKSSLQYILSGVDPIDDIIISGNEVTAVFESDCSNTFEGYEIDYFWINKNIKQKVIPENVNPEILDKENDLLINDNNSSLGSLKELDIFNMNLMSNVIIILSSIIFGGFIFNKIYKNTNWVKNEVREKKNNNSLIFTTVSHSTKFNNIPEVIGTLKKHLNAYEWKLYWKSTSNRNHFIFGYKSEDHENFVKKCKRMNLVYFKCQELNYINGRIEVSSNTRIPDNIEKSLKSRIKKIHNKNIDINKFYYQLNSDITNEIDKNHENDEFNRCLNNLIESSAQLKNLLNEKTNSSRHSVNFSEPKKKT